MTLSLAWVRRVGEANELVFASDSRLSGGQSWDGCPKIFTLPRGDSMVALAGSTLDAYPLLLQFRNWVEFDVRARNRERDVSEIKKRMRRMFMDMRRHISDLPVGATEADPHDCELIFGGWSWRAGRFQIWRFRWVAARGHYDFEPVGSSLTVSRNQPVAFAGTPAAALEARGPIVAMLKAKGILRQPLLDMEPFEVLRDIIREGRYHDVGGPPQIAKVYRHANSQPSAVQWPTSTGPGLTFLGRPLFEGERTTAPVLDPDLLEFRSAKTLANRARLGRDGAGGPTVASAPAWPPKSHPPAAAPVDPTRDDGARSPAT